MIDSISCVLAVDLKTYAFRHAAPEVKLLTGYDAAHLKGQGPGWFYSLMHPADADRLNAQYDTQTCKSETLPCIKYRLRCADGRYKWLHEDRAIIPAAADKNRPDLLVCRLSKHRHKASTPWNTALTVPQ
ncbi:PAS fold protein [Anaerohalosphaera lusitana]|uniref:PAS fold protein n=1 Tax=Anaerohalosphaera lusitana TaxID=1936003 RepID=A0A1U9NM33_9BACT|nr:PAS fold protein [Anaerohalosphaera lusitana]